MAISIVWYWEPTNTRQPQRLSQTSSKYNLIDTRARFHGMNSRIHGSQLRVQQLNDSDAGLYYCQGNLPNGTLLTPSNMLHLTMQSVYTDVLNVSKCPDMAQTTTNSSCASPVLDDSSTVSSTTPNLVTDGNRGPTDPPSSSPTINSQWPSLPTTVTLLPTPTATPAPESGMLRVALYAVISVIVVFCAVIVTLAVTIVILYRRKGGHTNLKKTAG